MQFLLIPLAGIAAATSSSAAEESSPQFIVPEIITYAITDVSVEERFAGRYGTRIRTELTLEAGDRKVTVHIQDVRHGQFQKADSPWLEGHQVNIPEIGTRSEVVLRPDQVVVTGYILPPNEIPKMYWVFPGALVGIPIPADIDSPGTS